MEEEADVEIPECVADAECDDANACTADTVTSPTGCVFESLVDDTECDLDGEAGLCREGACVVGVCLLTQLLGCDGTSCIETAIYGDDNCDESLNCEALSFDGGDCVSECGDGVCELEEHFGNCADDCDTCAEGLLKTCDASGCVEATLLGDGTCTAELDCEIHDLDQGDCVTCGDGECEGDEHFGTCADDCDTCAEGLLKTCDESGCVEEGSRRRRM